MGYDLAVATPAFLDLTFTGLEALPALGEERFGSDLLRSPGGGAITAVGAARLGLATALASPLGDDVAGDLVIEVLRGDGIEIVSRKAPRTPTTVVLPIGDDRAMVTVDPGVRSARPTWPPWRPVRCRSTSTCCTWCPRSGRLRHLRR